MKKRFIIAPLSLLIAFLATSASMSVAWFSNSDRLRIDGIDIAIEASKNLYISTSIEKEHYKEYLDYSELKHIGYFEPVSTMYSSSWLKEKAKMPKFITGYNSYNNTIIKENGNVYVNPHEEYADEGFYSQELYFYSDSNYWALIDTDNTFFLPNEEANREAAKKLALDTGRDEDTIYYELNSLVNSCRFSILVDSEEKYDYKIIDPNKNGTTKFGGLQDTDLNGTYDCTTDFLEGKKYEVLYGEVNDRNLIKYKDQSIKDEISGKHTWYNASHDENAYQIDFDASFANGLTIANEESLSFEDISDIKEKLLMGRASKEEINKMLLIPVNAGTPTRIVLSIYNEGWDLDNINDTMAASFISNISFGVIDKFVVK